MTSSSKRNQPEAYLSKVGKSFIGFAIAFPFGLAVVAVVKGRWETAASFFVLTAFIALIPAIGLFFLKHPVEARSNNLKEALRNFKRQYPGYKGKIVFYAIPVAMALTVFLKLFVLF